MALPGLVCIALLLCTLEATFHFLRHAYVNRLNLQTERSATGLWAALEAPHGTSLHLPPGLTCLRVAL